MEEKKKEIESIFNELTEENKSFLTFLQII